MIDLNKKATKNITKAPNKDLKPKSFRCNQNKLDELEEFRLKLEKLTNSHKCSDAKAINIVITIANRVTLKILDKSAKYYIFELITVIMRSYLVILIA